MPLAIERIANTAFHPELNLLTWHPQGLFDDDVADRMVEFLECEESSIGPFNRYTDLTGLTEIRLRIGHTFELATRRREHYALEERVKSAIFCDWVVGTGLARTYEAMMIGGPIKVRAFRTRKAAADWLGVPLSVLTPEP